jgi:hypothetical protein
MDLTEDPKMVTTSPTSRYALANSFSLRLLPRRFYKIRSEPSSTEVMLSRLFKLSLESLRGFMAVREICVHADLTTFVDVVTSQRYAQCRELATLLRYLDSSPDTMPRDVITLKRIWTKTLANLTEGSGHDFLEGASEAEQRLEDALLAAARQCDNTDVCDRLRAFAVNICSVRERLEEMLADAPLITAFK